MKRTLLIILACIIAIPFLLIAGYLSYSYSVDAYAWHTLKKAAPDFKKSSTSAPDHVSTYKRGGGIFKITICDVERGWR
jgi:hypothetical protein